MRSAPVFPWSLLAPLTLLASCADSNRVAAPDDTPAAQFAAANAPSQSGPNVFRGPFSPGFITAADAELAVAVGFEEPLADHCADFESPNQPGSTQVVVTPPGGFHVNVSGRDVRVLVFEFEGEVVDACELVGTPVASGTAHITVTVNGRQVAATVHGVIDLTTGGQARLLVTSITHFVPDGSIVFDHTRIRLTPL